MSEAELELAKHARWIPGASREVNEACSIIGTAQMWAENMDAYITMTHSIQHLLRPFREGIADKRIREWL